MCHSEFVTAIYRVFIHLYRTNPFMMASIHVVSWLKNFQQPKKYRPLIIDQKFVILK